MVSISNLGLDGLRTLFNTATMSTPGVSTLPQAEDIVQAQSDSVIVSSLAQDIGKTYNRLRAAGDQAAMAGFAKIVQGFGSALSGEEIAEIVTASTEMGTADLQQYGQLANTIDQLGNDATVYRYASQAASSYNIDAQLGRSYMAATEAIVSADYSASDGENEATLSNLGNFMDTWQDFLSDPQASSADLSSYQDFAEQVSSSTTDEEVGTAIANFNPTPGNKDPSAG